MTLLLSGGALLRADGSFSESTDLLIRDQKIAAIGADCAAFVPDQALNCRGFLISPGLIDAHTHGRSGFDFATATVEQMRQMQLDYAKTGVTSLFPTLASATLDEWKTAIHRIETCGFAGLHLEGRYLNPAKRGAHAAELLASLSAAELEELLDGLTLPCHITAAFELDADGAFTSAALRHGATLALGHTMATAEEARLAVSRGVTAFSHLFNAMPPLHHREGGAVAVALCGSGFGELIVDGLHVCPEMIKLAYRCLGRDKTVLISDSMEGTGCPDGEYSIAGQPVTLSGGKAMTHDGALAGSTLKLWDGVKNLMSFAEISLGEALLCATKNPAAMLGIEHAVGSLELGRSADLLLIDPESQTIQRVLYRGEWLSAEKGENI